MCICVCFVSTPKHVQASKPNETAESPLGEKTEKDMADTEKNQKSGLDNEHADNVDTALDPPTVPTVAATIGEPCMESMADITVAATIVEPSMEGITGQHDQREIEKDEKGARADDLATKSPTPDCGLTAKSTTPIPTPTVEADLRSYFGFFKDAISKTTTPASDNDGCDHGVDAHELARRLSSWTLSTAYSGIGAPESTLNLLHHELELLLGGKLPKHKVLSQVEYDASCRTVLLASNSADSPACIFGDLTSFFKPELADTIKHLKKRPDLALELLAGAVASGEACNACAYCYAHQRVCHMFLGRT